MADSFHHVYVSLIYVFLLFKRNNYAREQIRGSNLKGVPGSGDSNGRLRRLFRWVMLVARLSAMEMDTLTGLSPGKETREDSMH